MDTDAPPDNDARPLDRVPSAVLMAGLILALLALVALALYVGTLLPIDGHRTQQGSTRASLWVLLFGGAVMVTLLTVYLHAGIEDQRAHLPISPLYWPQLAVKVSMTAYMVFLNLAAIDLLSHDLQPHWKPLYTPLSRIVQSLLLLAVFVSFAWVEVVLLRGRGRFGPRSRGRDE